MKLHMCPKCRKSLANRHNFPGTKRIVDQLRTIYQLLAFLPSMLMMTICSPPKYTLMGDEIINDTPDDMDVASQTSLPAVAVKQNSLSDVIPRVIPQQILPNPFPSKKSIVPSKPSAEVIAEVFPSLPVKELTTTNCRLPPPQVVEEVFPEVVKTKPRTKGVIIGFSDGKSDEDDDDEQSTDEEMYDENEEDDSDSIDDTKPKGEDMEMEIEEFTIPDTIEGGRDRFNELYMGFMRHNKREHTNELMFLLDKMLRQGAITPTEYA